MKSSATLEMFKPVQSVVIWMSIFYLLCHFGDKVTDHFDSLSDSYYEVLWYRLPVKQQKYFILLILNAQKPIYLEAFTLQNTRETFKKVISIISMEMRSMKYKFAINKVCFTFQVINTVYTYFMSLRQFI